MAERQRMTVKEKMTRMAIGVVLAIGLLGCNIITGISGPKVDPTPNAPYGDASPTPTPRHILPEGPIRLADLSGPVIPGA